MADVGFKVNFNTKEFVKKNKEIEKAFLLEVKKALQATTLVVDRELKESMARPKKGNLVEIRKSRNSKRYRVRADKIKNRQKPQPYRIVRRRHRAGAKGEPIAVDTGSYRRSIKLPNGGKPRRLKNGYEVEVMVGVGIKYAGLAEKRNPTMKPAFDKGSRFFQRSLKIRLGRKFR